MSYKKEFIEFMHSSGVLMFGDFVTKSGRRSPYFMNTGNYKTGRQMARLGGFYAACLNEHGLEPDILFGPAYKGIPLCVTTSVAMYSAFDKDVGYCFNRKEEKDHGEGGVLIGQKPSDGDSVVIIEDVITAGTAIRETLPILQNAAKVEIAGVIISVDRMERGKGELSAVQEVYNDFGIRVYPIVTIEDIISCIRDGTLPVSSQLDKMLAYREQYGV